MERINTIFHFPDSLTFNDYLNMYQAGNISGRTIVFADAQRAIYKGGKKYGGLDTHEFYEAIDSLYDDSWISDEINGIKSDISDADARINGLNTLISGINVRLNGQIDSLDTNIQDKVEALFADIQWLRDNFTPGVVGWQQGWNDNIAAYLRTVGYWDIDDQGNEVYKWSKILQSVNSISATVSSLTADGIIPQSLLASIEALIQGDIAQLNLGTSYAAITDVNNLKSVVEWLYSGLKSQSDPNSTFAEIFAAGKNSLTSSIANIRTYVDKLDSGDYVATSEVTAKVKDSLATLITRAESDNVLAALSAKADANSDDIAALLLGMTGSSSTADIQTRIANVISGFTSTSDIDSAKSEIYSAISAKDNNNNFISLAALKTAVDANTASISAISTNGADMSGFVSKAGLGESVAELFAASGDNVSADAKASVVALVRDNKASLNLTASDVNIAGYLNAGDATFKGNIQANEFITGDSSETGISVMSGQFDSTNANTNKAYFAYDQTQGAITMWFYLNNSWKRIDVNGSQVLSVEEGFIRHTVYNLDENSMYLPKVQDLTPIYIYESRTSGRCYVQANSQSNYATGTYYKINNYRDRVPNYYRAYGDGSGERESNLVGTSLILYNDGQELVNGYNTWNENGEVPTVYRQASETIFAGEINQFVVDSNGYIQESNTNTVSAYYQVVDVNTELQFAGTGGGSETTGDDWKFLVQANYVKPQNTNNIGSVALLCGTYATFVNAVTNKPKYRTVGFVPCTLHEALTYVSEVVTDLGNHGEETDRTNNPYVSDYPVKYIDAGRS